MIKFWNQLSGVFWFPATFCIINPPVTQLHPASRSSILLKPSIALGTMFWIIILNLWPSVRAIWYMIWHDMIHLLTAVGLSPGGSITAHIYTHTIHRTTQITRVRGVPRLCEFYPGICLTTEEKAWKNFSRCSQNGEYMKICKEVALAYSKV